MYSECVIHLLSPIQINIFFNILMRVLNNREIERGEYLLIHFDETWFWRMLPIKKVETFGGLNP